MLHRAKVSGENGEKRLKRFVKPRKCAARQQNDPAPRGAEQRRLALRVTAIPVVCAHYRQKSRKRSGASSV
jgi:hypothetical protein